MLQDQVNKALQSLKEGKAIGDKPQQQRALRSLIDPRKFEKDFKSISYGGLLIRVFDKYIKTYRLNQVERDDVISATFADIYKDVENIRSVDGDGKITKGLSFIMKVFSNQAKRYVRGEITARGDWHYPSDETREKVKDWSTKGHTYRYIGYELRASYDVLIKSYEAELAFGKEVDFDKEAKRTKHYFLESRKETVKENINNEDDNLDDWGPEMFISEESDDIDEGIEERVEPIDFSSKPHNKSMSSESKNLEDCTSKGYESFEAEEPDRAFVLNLKFTDFYDKHTSFLKKAWIKFRASEEIIYQADRRKLSSKEIGEIIGKTAANVDVYFNESKKKFQKYVEHCRKFLK